MSILPWLRLVQEQTSHETLMVIAWPCSLPPSPPDSVSGSPHDHSPLWSHRMTTQTVQSFNIKIIITKLLLTLFDQVRTVSHDRGLGYSNRLWLCRVCARYPHHGVLPSPSTPELVPQDPWNSSRRSELDFSNETCLPRNLPTVSPTSCLGYPCVLLTPANLLTNRHLWQNRPT